MAAGVLNSEDSDITNDETYINELEHLMARMLE